MKIATLAVIGVGLIGGSCALALKRAGAVERVLGVGRSRANLDVALERGVIDEAFDDAAAAAARADVVLIAAPVAQTEAILASIAKALPPTTIVTDAGSTKASVITAARRTLGSRFARFVPAHPIAGTEHSGAAAAFAELFRDRKVVLTPERETQADARETVRALWQACGARVLQLSAEEHDRVFAAVSHLPHLLAFALVDDIARRGNADTLFHFAASGFRDFTRIASSHPEMWRDICADNALALRAELTRFREQLAAVDELFARRDWATLEAVFTRARDARNAWLAAIEQGERRAPAPSE